MNLSTVDIEIHMSFCMFDDFYTANPCNILFSNEILRFSLNVSIAMPPLPTASRPNTDIFANPIRKF